MEKLALGISLICLVYIGLFYLLNWFSQLWEDDEIQERWSGIKRTGRLRLKRLLNVRMKEQSRKFAK